MGAPSAAKSMSPSTKPMSQIDSHVNKLLRETKPLPPITWSNWYKEVRWFNLGTVTLTPVIGLYGAMTTELRWSTFCVGLFFAWFSLLGITAGYHRLWAHRAYNASKPLEYVLAIAGASSVQGAIRWWVRGHRSHHRFTDTDLDPYNAERGFWYSHILWMVMKPRIKPGPADITDLQNNEVVRWQYEHYFPIALISGVVIPTTICGYFFGDWRGGCFYASIIRIVIIHHCTFCVNSVAHMLGDKPFDDKKTPRDHLITALLTLGEGYHNFHHQFPMDYRNAIKWYQYDPTKWFIRTCGWLGLATHLRTFPDSEVDKGRLTMELKKLKRKQDSMKWPKAASDLPVIDWESYQQQSRKRPLILVSGFIHDISSFVNEHPGGRGYLTTYIGKDATTAIFGGVYEHSNAAHNLLSMMRVGVLLGGTEHVTEAAIPPSQKLHIVERTKGN